MLEQVTGGPRVDWFSVECATCWWKRLNHDSGIRYTMDEIMKLTFMSHGRADQLCREYKPEMTLSYGNYKYELRDAEKIGELEFQLTTDRIWNLKATAAQEKRNPVVERFAPVMAVAGENEAVVWSPIDEQTMLKMKHSVWRRELIGRRGTLYDIDSLGMLSTAYILIGDKSYRCAMMDLHLACEVLA